MTWLLVIGVCFATYGSAQPRLVSLQTSHINLVLTPDAGGRVLSLSLKGESNFLKQGGAVKQPLITPINERSPFVAYFGHEVWFGPQSEWWQHQLINPQRRAMKAAWPPDPFSVLVTNQLLLVRPDKIVMQSPVSPITGLQVEKTFALVTENSRQIDLLVKAKNIRDTPVAWDLWFNTRSFPQTRIYAPVDQTTKVRTMSWPSPNSAPINYEIDQDLLSVKLENPPEGKSKLMGKILFQPTEGWFAAFNQKQLLIVQFPHQPIGNIHPEQGQLEFYMEYSPTDDSLGVLEMEVHSAYKKLKPGEEMQARERWTLIEYSGDESADAQRKFLREQLKGLRRIVSAKITPPNPQS